MSEFATEYSIFVFIASLGAIQIGASVGELSGLLLVRSPLLARALGTVVIVAAVVWFFASENRNINDYEGGLDANGQGLYFFYSALGAVIVTLVVSSLVNHRLTGGHAPRPDGFDALKHTMYIRALWRSLRYWSREWRTQTKNYFFG